MRRTKRQSIVWKYFTRPDEDKTVKCTICAKQARYYGNTSNLKQHITRKHRQMYLESNAQVETMRAVDYIQVHSSDDNDLNQKIEISVPSDSCFLVPSTQFSNVVSEETVNSTVASSSIVVKKINDLTQTDKDELDSCVVNMIVTDLLPTSIAESKGFLEYTKKLQPLYTPPNENHLTNSMIPNLYCDVVEKVKTMLDEINYLGITTEMWTWNSNKTYITAAAHFIHNDTLRTHVLSTRELIEINSDHVGFVLLDIFREWNIVDKVVTVVTDNNENVRNAVIYYVKKYHHPCLAHTLNVTISDAISKNEELNILLTKCRTLVNHFTYDAIASKTFDETQIKMAQPEIKLQRDVTGTCKSILTMLESLVASKISLSVAITELPNAPPFLEASEWHLIPEIIKLLSPFDSMTKEMARDKYIFVALVIPLIRGLQLKIKNTMTDAKPAVNLKQVLLSNIDKTLGHLESNKVVAKATFLDPRLKKAAFGTEDNGNNAQKWVNEEVIEFVNKRKLEAESSKSTSLVKNESDSLWLFFEQKVAEMEMSQTPAAIGDVLVKQYSDMPHLQRRKDPLEFWKLHKLSLSELYQMHLKYSCIPATSIPSEQIFSKSGQIPIYCRNRVEPKDLDKIIFLNSYMSS